METYDNLFEVFRNRRVFITGHTGFKGSWLAFILNNAGAQVMGYALPPDTKTSHFNLIGLDKSIQNVFGDIRDIDFLKNELIKFQPEFVFHLAAQALVKSSYEDPINTFSTNLIGSVNLLDAVRHTKSVRSLVYITSDKCYENVEWVWGYRENDRMGGYDPYSASKGAAELAFSSYSRSYFDSAASIGVASARAGNVIGGGDWAVDRIIPDCIRAIIEGKPVQLRNPNATRPWQHVLEPLSGYLLLAKLLYENPKKWSGPWNFGPATDQVLTVKNVADLLVQYIGRGSVDILEEQSIFHEANLLQLNCDKAHNLLKWYPRWGIKKTIEMTAAWYKSFMQGDDLNKTTRAQIDEFFERQL
jgi:CDP-glucose 4,6-dehydratase